MAKTGADTLFVAVEKGDLGPFRTAPLETVQKSYLGGDTLSYLHLAARAGHVRLCELLIARGIDVNRTADGRWGGTALQVAAAHGHLDVVRALLAHGALVDGVTWAMATPLMDAARNGHIDIVRTLIASGADIHREGLGLPQTALDFAIAYIHTGLGQAAVAELLRQHGAYRPYFERHDWSASPHHKRIAAIEHALDASVSPAPLLDGRVAIYRARIPKRYDFQLVFTCGRSDDDVAIVLPSSWPLHRAALLEPRFAAPIRWLERRGNPSLGEVVVDDAEGWPGVPVLSVRHAVLDEAARRGGHTMMYVPLKRTIKAGAARAKACMTKPWKALAFAPWQ